MLQEVIESKLQSAFNPSYLQVLNESYLHNVPSGAESHFKVVVVSDMFENIRLIARHRKINTALSQELEEAIHALSIHTFTPQEWADRDEAEPESVKCKGGDK